MSYDSLLCMHLASRKRTSGNNLRILQAFTLLTRTALKIDESSWCDIIAGMDGGSGACRAERPFLECSVHIVTTHIHIPDFAITNFASHNHFSFTCILVDLFLFFP